MCNTHTHTHTLISHTQKICLHLPATQKYEMEMSTQTKADEQLEEGTDKRPDTGRERRRRVKEEREGGRKSW